MQELLILMATAVPTEKLVEDLKEAIFNWEINPNDSTKQNLLFQAQLVLVNHITNGDVKKAISVIKDIGNMEKLHSHMNSTN